MIWHSVDDMFRDSTLFKAQIGRTPTIDELVGFALGRKLVKLESTPPTLLQFRYTNWRGDDHTYVIAPENVVTFEPHGAPGNDPHWQLHGRVILRDGATRPEMGDNTRRSFLLSGIRDLEEV